MCAAISAVLQGAVLGVTRVAKAKVQYKTDDKKGSLQFALADGQDEQTLHDAETILRSALLSVADIAANYSQYVSLEVKEL